MCIHVTIPSAGLPHSHTETAHHSKQPTMMGMVHIAYPLASIFFFNLLLTSFNCLVTCTSTRGACTFRKLIHPLCNYFL